MFRASINSSPFTTPMADGVFSNITGVAYTGNSGGDISLLATLRALVAPRMSENERLDYNIADIHYSLFNPDRMLNLDFPGRITIYSLQTASHQQFEPCVKAAKAWFDANRDDWQILNKVTDFFRKSFEVYCFLNVEIKSVCIIVENLDVKKLHYLQCAIVAFLPWYFSEGGVSELEMNLIRSFSEKTPDNYRKYLAEIAEQYDFRSMGIRNLLTGFESRYTKMECERTQGMINDYENKIQTLNEQIGATLRLKVDMEIRLLGLKAKIANEEAGGSEIMDYFLCNKKLVLESVTDTCVTFSCMDYLTYFDEDMAKQMIDNPRSYVYRPNYRNCQDIFSEEDMKKLMYAIFVNQTLRMKVCSAYKFELRGNVTALNRHQYGFEFAECTPNPHIDKYSCMGEHQRAVNERLRENDYIGAIEQCVASCKSLNFADSAVMDEFMLRLYGVGESKVNTRCIELPNGEVVTPKVAIKWLNEQEEEADEQNN